MPPHIAAKTSQLLALALEYESCLRLVNLNMWERVHATGGNVRLICQGLVELYFGGFRLDPAAADADASTPQPSAVRGAFLARLNAICFSPEDAALLCRCRWEWRRPVVSVHDLPSNHVVEHPRIALRGPDALLVSVWPCLYKPMEPFFGQFEALANRAWERRRRQAPKQPQSASWLCS